MVLKSSALLKTGLGLGGEGVAQGKIQAFCFLRALQVDYAKDGAQPEGIGEPEGTNGGAGSLFDCLGVLDQEKKS